MTQNLTQVDFRTLFSQWHRFNECLELAVLTNNTELAKSMTDFIEAIAQELDRRDVLTRKFSTK